MAHMIDFTTGRAAMAYRGETPWHGLGAVIPDAQANDIGAWIDAAGLNWHAQMTQGFMKRGDALVEVPNCKHCVRSDNGAVLGTFSDQYRPVQPLQVLEFFRDFILQDDRFHLETAGALRDGKTIWALARFADDVEAGGDVHKAYLLLTTSFDGSLATTGQATLVRVVCNNTLTASVFSGQAATIKVRHSTVFDRQRQKEAVGALADVAATFPRYKAMADGLANDFLSDVQISSVFKDLLEIPFDAAKADVSTRKLNQFEALNDAYRATVLEGPKPGSKWAVLNAVTRYADHDRSTKGDDQASARLYSANFGSGALLKRRALELVMAKAA